MVHARTRVLLGVLALACTCASAPPAVADGRGRVIDGLPHPVVGIGDDDPAHAALTCGLVAISDPTSAINQDPNQMTGPVTGGPWAVGDLGTTSVTVTCTVQTNSADPDAGVTATIRRTSRSNTVPGTVGFLVDTILFSRGPDDDVFLCTDIAWLGAEGARSWRFDADDSVPGVQCDRAMTIDF